MNYVIFAVIIAATYGSALMLAKAANSADKHAKKLDDEKKRIIHTGNRCVSCGSDIPEGRQVCPMCEMTVSMPQNGETSHEGTGKGNDGTPKALIAILLCILVLLNIVFCSMAWSYAVHGSLPESINYTGYHIPAGFSVNRFDGGYVVALHWRSATIAFEPSGIHIYGG